MSSKRRNLLEHIARIFIRTSSFLIMEIVEILRQPRLVLTLVLGPFLILLLFGIGAYSRRPAERLWANTWGWRPPARARAFALIPIIRLVGDVAKMVGYPEGVWWRLRRGRWED